MSYKGAIESRKEEVANMEIQLAKAKEAGDDAQVEEITRRIDLVKSAIKGLEKLKKLG